MWKVLFVSLVLALVGGSGALALYKYDASRSDLIAEGVEIAGIDVGGMGAEEARATLRRQVVRPLERPLVLRYEERRFVLTSTRTEIRTNVPALVRAALRESRKGNFLTRSVRDLTGRGVRVQLPLRVEYSREAVANFVAGIEQAIERPARRARNSVSFTGVTITPSQHGVAVRARALREAIGRRLVRPDAGRVLAVPTRTVRPQVTTEDLTERFSHFISINRTTKVLRLFIDLKLVKTYRVGIGRIGFETPAGLYAIETKAGNPAWYVPSKPWAGQLAGEIIPPDDPRNPIKARWLGFHDGAGIHGTADEGSIGTAASHGCIRMTVPEVIDLYERVPLETPLYIA